ncbi:DNA-(apurinic or apyrimidinic site) lyase [Nymphon striatum]|nr:DNA-(apurinic or apyrimidinic site) lyase [Nymphon striatum]
MGGKPGVQLTGNMVKQGDGEDTLQVACSSHMLFGLRDIRLIFLKNTATYNIILNNMKRILRSSTLTEKKIKLDHVSNTDFKTLNTAEVKKKKVSKNKAIKSERENCSQTKLSPNIVDSKKTCKKYLGAHVSAAGGLHNAVTEAVNIGATSFALFLRSQRQWASKPLEDKIVEKFKQACKDHGFPSHLILPHGSYLMNCGSAKEEILEKSRATLIDELKRCEKLGIDMYNFHPGSTCGEITRKESIKKIAESINIAHKETSKVITVIENMSKQGNTIGGDFQELRDIIDQVENKDRIGVCLDTCHAFAAGYDLSTEKGYQEMMSDFENIIGINYLKAVHLNDSKSQVGSHLDRHENIGKGFIKLDGFQRLMNDDRFNNMPLILETPEDDYKHEIKVLEKLET